MTLLDSLRARLQPTDDSHRVTTLELFFDLVFVYAITNVTGLMEHGLSGWGVLQGLIMLALVCGLAIAVCLWWLYFDVVAHVGERVLLRSSGVDRARLARDVYTYVHFLFVASIVFVALGLVVLIHDDGHVEAGRYALYGGIVCYLVGHLLFRLRNVGGVNKPRAVAGLTLLAGIPTLGGLDTLGQIAVEIGE